MANPDITVAIPTYKRERILLDSIQDILQQSHNNFELMVIDQSPEHPADFKQAIAAIKDKRFRYILADPPSLPAARNFALHHAVAPIVLFLDDDVLVNQDLLKNCLLAFREHPEVSVVGGRILQKGFPIKKEVLRFDEYGISNGVFTATEPAYTNAFPGGNCALKVNAALSIGGFDTRFFGNAFREESDMAIRMTKAGMKIFYEPRASLTHLAVHSGGTRDKSYGDILDTQMFYRNELFFTLRAVELSNLPTALYRKHIVYCRGRGKKIGIKRTLYFGLGLLAALWRQVFGRQIMTKERVA